jgi:hypothetical protein
MPYRDAAHRILVLDPHRPTTHDGGEIRQLRGAVMSTTTIGIAQWHPACGEPRRNLDTALAHIGSLAAQGCEVIVLPELWASGYEAASLADDAAVAPEPLDGERGRQLDRRGARANS